MIGAVRALGVFCCMAMVLWSAMTYAEAPEPRLALVIGNSAYGADIGNLANPANDARLMAATLRKVGFTVIELEDADRKKMSRAIVDFGEALAKAGGQATGLFFYAGHGLQVAGENYLIPIAADITREGDVETEAVSSDLVLRQMDFAGNAVNIVILDACRNNPLNRSFRSQTRGLAEPRTKPRGSFIAYSTAPGDVAADGAGDDSPYALALSEAMLKPGIGIEEIFRDVRSRVLAATQQKQTPWDSSSLTAPFYFIPSAETAVVETAPSPGTDKSVELAYWNAIANSTNPAMFEKYLKRFPNGEFADIAAAKLEELRQGAEGQKSRAPTPPADDGPEIAALDATYVAVQGANVRAAPSTDAKIVARLKADDPVQVTGQVKSKDWFRVEFEGGAGFVNATLLTPVDANEIAEWRDLKAVPDAEAAKAFLAKHPDGYFKPKAEALLASLERSAEPEPPAASTQPSAAQAVAPTESTMKAGTTFRDCADCPEMVVIPPGKFIMGAADGETGTYHNESPQHQVAILKPFAVGRFEITNAEYATFVQASGYDSGSSCYTDTVNVTQGVNWLTPGFAGYTPAERDPVVCVSWQDAQAYITWLTQKTGKHYRLLTEAEFEYATRAGSTTIFPWGADPNSACPFANVADVATMATAWWRQNYTAVSCNDGAGYTMPVGRYQPNAFGLFDMIGNVNEWVADCYVDGYGTAPTDGSAVEITNCQQRAVRGGGWSSVPYLTRSAARTFAPANARLQVDGFRIARDL